MIIQANAKNNIDKLKTKHEVRDISFYKGMPRPPYTVGCKTPFPLKQ